MAKEIKAAGKVTKENVAGKTITSRASTAASANKKSKTAKLLLARYDNVHAFGTLQSMLVKAATMTTTNEEREFHPSMDGTSEGDLKVVLTQHFKSSYGCFCGTLIQFEKDAVIPAAKYDPKGSDVDLSALTKNDLQGNDVVEGILHFIVSNDSLAVITSRNVGIGHLEMYLNWFISEKTQVARDIRIVISGADFEQLSSQLSDVREIVIEKVVRTTDADPTISSPSSNDKSKATINQIIQFFTSSSSELTLNHLTAGALLKTKFSISLQDKTSEEARVLISSIALVLRDDPNARYTIHLRGGSTISESTFKIEGTIHVKANSKNGLIYVPDAYSALSAWLLKQKSGTKIVAQ